MGLSASTNVAAAIANFFPDNYTALLQAGAAAPPAGTYIAPQTQAFADWKAANQNKQFYLIESGSTYKLGSVTGTSTALPTGAKPVDLNVAYAIESKEFSLTDWVMGRVADEIRRALTLEATASALLALPEVDMNTDFSSMSQADLQLMLQRLVTVSKVLKQAMALDDKQFGASALGLAVSRLAEAIDQQALFLAQAETLQTDGNAKTDDFNEMATAALELLVQTFSEAVAAAQTALKALNASGTSTATLGSVVQTVSTALAQRLRAAADLVLLATAAEELFGQPSDVQSTSDGNVLQTAAAEARALQIAAVRMVLVSVLQDPGLQQALVDAMFASAEALGTSELSVEDQRALYGTVAAAVVQAFLLDDKLLTQMATEAVNFGNDLSQWLGAEALSASARDSALSESMA